MLGNPTICAKHFFDSRPEISSKTILLSHSSVTLLYSMDTCTVWFIVKSDRDYAQEQLAT